MLIFQVPLPAREGEGVQAGISSELSFADCPMLLLLVCMKWAALLATRAAFVVRTRA